MKQYDITIQKLPEDSRLDKAIPLHCADISRSLARKLIENGAVYVNRKRCRQSAKTLQIGDQVRFFIAEQKEEEKPEESDALPESSILFEDADWIVVNKPPFLPTHATIDCARHHLALAVQKTLAARQGNKDPKLIYLGIHHRLDRDTSGVILFTKRKEANAAVAQAFQAREVQKTYLAVSLGCPKEKQFTIQSHIGPSPKNKRRFASVLRGGKHAETEITLLESKILHSRKISLLAAKPVTGRTHQIRVHLSENRLPILGDETYGVNFPGVPRLLLHAWRLEILGKTFVAPPPVDFQNLDFKPPQH